MNRRFAGTARVGAALSIPIVVFLGGLRPGAPRLAAQGTQATQPAQPPASIEIGGIHVLPARNTVYMLVGPSVNAAVQLGDDGLVIVDTMRPADGQNLLRVIRSLAPTTTIRYIINTAAADDHTGGNDVISKAGRYLSRERFALGFADPAAATIFAHEQALNWISMPHAGREPVPADRWPTDTYFNERQEFFSNGEGVQLIHEPAAHTRGDSMVFFRRSDVLVTGDLFTPEQFPSFDAAQGGTINGLVAALNDILDVTLPGPNEEGGTLVIPGHGRLCDESDVGDYRDMVTIVRDRVKDLVNKKKTLAEIQAAKLTRDYDGIYASPSYTGDMFVQAVFQSLTQPVSPANTPPK